MTDRKKTVISGIQPTGQPHIGNYFGMMKQLVEMQNEYSVFGMIVDYHALTTVSDAATLRRNIKEVTLDMLAVGLDPKKCIFFRQSDVPEHAELAWIFNCLVTVPWLSRAHAFKDKTEKGIEASVGLFDYPVLMAADILMYDTNLVPVGKDQKQHVEMAREVAAKFNNRYGETFALPQELIKEEVAVVPGTDGQKMSKSYGNVIPLFGTDEEIKKAVMSIVTDSGTGIPEHVYAIHKLFRSESELAVLYEEKKGKYKDLKEALLEDVLNLVRPMRERRAYYEARPVEVAAILDEGAVKAREIAQAKMHKVRKACGLA